VPTIFYPGRRTGLILQGGAVALLLAGSLASMLLAFQQSVGLNFILLLLASLLLMVPLILVSYRTYALFQATYSLDRDGLHLRWGLRAEDIPLAEIEWVRPAGDLGYRLPLPLIYWPGAILGSRKVDGLGAVEFLASEASALLLVATKERVFAISPADVHKFMRAFQATIEMGSLSPIRHSSVLPESFVQGVLSNRLARSLMIAGLLFTLGLLIVVSLRIPTLSQVSLGFDPQGRPLEPVPPDRLLLLPILGAFTFTIDLVTGLFFYRRKENRLTAYLLWASSIFFPILLIIATFKLP
jgi:hypothetical protein